jgi:hypothetical protein
VHQVCAESYAVGYMDEFSMTVVVQIDSSCTLTALSMTCMTSLTEIVLAHFVTNIAFALSLNSHLQKQTERFDHRTVQFGF